MVTSVLITPAQSAMVQLIGRAYGLLRPRDLKSGMRRGRGELKLITGLDFGYDAQRWHDHLWTNDIAGYRWRRHEAGVVREIVEAITNPAWIQACKELGQEPDQP